MRAGPDDGAAAAVEVFLSAARAAWPALRSVSDTELVAYATERIVPGEAIHALRAGDLLLACASLRGDTAALESLDAMIAGETAAAWARARPPISVDEARQLVRTRILVGDGAAPKLALYGGQGDLRAWIRVLAMRALLNAATRAPREQLLGERVLDAISDQDDPELAYLKKLYRNELKAAFASAVEMLSERDRALLRYVLVDDLTVDDLGELYGVHRATAARWVTTARGELEKATRKLLTERLRIDEAQLRSIVRLVGSQLDLSMTRVLGAAVGS